MDFRRRITFEHGFGNKKQEIIHPSLKFSYIRDFPISSYQGDGSLSSYQGDGSLINKLLGFLG